MASLRGPELLLGCGLLLVVVLLGMAVINTDLCESNEWSSGGSGTPGCRKGCGANCGKGGIPAKGGRLKELASEGSRGESIKS